MAWVVRSSNVLAIPKASDAAHVRQNREALDLVLDEDDIAEIERAFPPPKHATRLDML